MARTAGRFSAGQFPCGNDLLRFLIDCTQIYVVECVVKVGTKVRGIRLISDGVGDHDIDAKVPGFGQMQLKSSVVKKVL